MKKNPAKVYFANEKPSNLKPGDVWVDLPNTTAYRTQPDGSLRKKRTDVPAALEEWMLCASSVWWGGPPDCESEKCPGHIYFDDNIGTVSVCDPVNKTWITMTTREYDAYMARKNRERSFRY